MTTANDAMAGRTIELSRIFDAPRELVWRAFTEPDQLAEWWGPAGFRLTTKSRDFRPGGTWRYVMHGPDGHDYPNISTFREIVPNERLTYKQGGEAEFEPINFEVTVTFEKLDGNKTRLTMRSVFPDAAARDHVVNTYNALEGGKQHLGRLAQHLDFMTSAPTGKPFVISRVFNAPIELVWDAWTSIEQLAAWFGPPNVTVSNCTLDLRPGGQFHYYMADPAGAGHWGKWVFRTIERPIRLEFLVSFADEKANTIPAFFDADWPLEMLSVVTFAPHAGISKGTVVRIEWTAHNATPAQQSAFDRGHASMNQGWTGTLDRLTRFLAR